MPNMGEARRKSAKSARSDVNAAEVLGENAKQYCESTTIHGFAYWVSAPRYIYYSTLKASLYFAP